MFLLLANGKKNIEKQFEGNGGLSGVNCFKGYVKELWPSVTRRGQVARCLLTREASMQNGAS